MEFDIHSAIKVAIGIGSTDGRDAGASTVSAIIDTLGYESFAWLIDVGTITTGTFTATIEQGDDSGLSDAAAVPAATADSVKITKVSASARMASPRVVAGILTT